MLVLVWAPHEAHWASTRISERIRPYCCAHERPLAAGAAQQKLLKDDSGVLPLRFAPSASALAYEERELRSIGKNENTMTTNRIPAESFVLKLSEFSSVFCKSFCTR